MQLFVEQEYQKAVPIFFEQVSCHEKMMIGGLDDAGRFAMGICPLVMELVVSTIGFDAHQQQLGMGWVGSFFPGEKGDALLVHSAVIKMDPAMREAIPVVDRPSLREYTAT